MDAMKFIMTRNRMCEANGTCSSCPINRHSIRCDCVGISESKLKEMMEIVEQWGKEHPVKTYKDDFLEKFPNADRYEAGHPVSCRNIIYGLGSCASDSCEDCWNKPMEG